MAFGQVLGDPVLVGLPDDPGYALVRCGGLAEQDQLLVVVRHVAVGQQAAVVVGQEGLHHAAVADPGHVARQQGVEQVDPLVGGEL